MKSPLLLLMLACFALHASGQKAIDEQIFTVNTSTLQSLHLYNMNGPVSVKGVEGKVASLKSSVAWNRFPMTGLRKQKVP